MRTIESFEDYVAPIQEAIGDLLLPTLFSQTEPLPSDLRQLVTLTPAQGGLGVPDLRFKAPQQFAASTLIREFKIEHYGWTSGRGLVLVDGGSSTNRLAPKKKEIKIVNKQAATVESLIDCHPVKNVIS